MIFRRRKKEPIFCLPKFRAFRRLIGSFGRELGQLIPLNLMIYKAVDFWNWMRRMHVYWLKPLRYGRERFLTQYCCLQLRAVWKMWKSCYRSPKLPLMGFLHRSTIYPRLALISGFFFWLEMAAIELMEMEAKELELIKFRRCNSQLSYTVFVNFFFPVVL